MAAQRTAPAGPPLDLHRVLMPVGAQPVRFGIRSGSDFSRSQRGILREIPLRSDVRELRREVIDPCKRATSRAKRAAGSAAGATHDYGVPPMAEPALPVDLLATPRGHLTRRQTVIPLVVPLRRDLGELRPQVVEANQDLPIHADGTAVTAVGAACDDGRPVVTAGPLPMHFPVATRHYLVGPERAIHGVVPFRCDFGKRRFQVVEARQHLPADADRAAALILGTFSDLGLPLVPSNTALPVRLLVAPGGHLVWCQADVLLVVPLGGDVGELRRQVVEARQHPVVGTHRAAGAPAGALRDFCLPLVPKLVALPVDLLVTARSDLIRRQTAVLLEIPLDGNVGELRPDVVEARQDLLIRADRAAVTIFLGALDYLGLPLVPEIMALPVDLLVTARSDLIRRQTAVRLEIPLRGNLGELRPEIVEARQHLRVGAHGTSTPLGAVRYRGHPLVPGLPTPPMDLLVTTRSDLIRRQTVVRLEIPLRGNLGEPRGE
ncbi:hypothetical protein GFS60_07176 (plasmid) [Rhodococcus sp. WAY2]|nr:hypothetical protein GFS60_07176 [Rhodococcus sp. WAY2]